MAKKYPFKYKGIHHCEAALLTCVDFRFWREAVDFAESELRIKDFDFPSLPGAAKAINECRDNDVSSQCISVPCNLHNAEKIIIVNHADCGAYGGAIKFNGDIEAEQKFHENELQKAKEKILAKYPDKKIILIYAKLVDDGDNIEFIVIS
jgi:hypothetical protein